MKSPSVVFVIGASSGIGKATAIDLLDRGHKVYGSSRNKENVKIEGVNALSVDVFDEESMQNAVNEIIKREGRIDGFIYSAGFYFSGAVEEMPLDDVRAQMQVYFFGAVKLTQLVLPYMRQQNSGRLLFMSSTAGVISIPFHAAYSASKGALGSWTEALAYELKPFNIRASYIEAGSINSNALNAMQIPKNPLNIYDGPRSSAELAFKKALGGGLSTERVGRSIADAYENTKPKVQYRIGFEGRFFPVLRSVLGERIFRAVIAKAFQV